MAFDLRQQGCRILTPQQHIGVFIEQPIGLIAGNFNVCSGVNHMDHALQALNLSYGAPGSAEEQEF
jgi:hypothetical protein